MHRIVLVAALLAAGMAGCLQNLDPTGGPGDWAREFLQPDPYSELVFEVDYVSGERPSNTAMSLLEQRAKEHLRKPDGVTVNLDDEISESRDQWTTQQIRDLESRHRDRTKSGSTAIMYIVYLDGRFAGGSGTVGLAYQASSFAIFHEKIKDASSGVLSASPQDVEKAVVVHEMGHNLGLVNNGIPMACEDHEDPDHRKHSTNRDSVMYWAVETNPVDNFFGGRFSGAPPTQFDSNDECDMEAAGGK